jgi:chemotaxis response regulator CheB
VDLLLTSVALTAPHRTIAVIHSGGGNNGATGATQFTISVVSSSRPIARPPRTSRCRPQQQAGMTRWTIYCR